MWFYIVEKELSYKIVGVLFDVHKQLGNRFQEKYYQRAIAQAFSEANISFKKELPVDLYLNDAKIGKYILDFLVEGRIILEIKAVPRLAPKDFKQVLAYLIANKLELGLIANFRTDTLTYKRVLNANLKTIQNNS